MKKFICIMGHPKRFMCISMCDVNDFENDDEAIRVYRCKYCGEYVAAYTRFVKAKLKKSVLMRSNGE